MWNKIRIWFNRNDFKILAWILAIICGYCVIKGANNYFRNVEHQQGEENLNTEQNISVASNTQYSDEDFSQIEEQTEDFSTAKNVVDKIINKIYWANEKDDVALKQDVLNMCSKTFIEKLTTDRRIMSADNILKYVTNVSGINNYSVQEIRQYGEEDNVKKYIVSIRNESDVISTDYYMIVNIDYNNNTFSYDGTIMDLNYINNSFDRIENNGSNEI